MIEDVRVRKDFEDLNDMTEMLRKLSNCSDIDKWITQWRADNAKADADTEGTWNDSFPSVGDISITSDIVDGVIQIWVKKTFMISGRVISIAQQVF